jgi:hypothetical protein
MKKADTPRNCIIVDGSCYEAVQYEGYPFCDGCAFETENEGCKGKQPCINLFNDWQIRFKFIGKFSNPRKK